MKPVSFLGFCLWVLPVFLHAQDITTTEWKKLVPSGNIPRDINVMRSNNNIDLTQYKDRFYMVFRTAPTHFASKKTTLFVLSSPDKLSWELENTIALGTDAREPRFCVYHDTLHLYCFEAGSSMFTFQPQNIWESYTLGDKNWSALYDTELDGFVPWRVRVYHDTILMSAYYGVDLYKAGHHGNLRLLQSTDGKHFAPISESPQCETPGAEEGEFIIDRNGDLFGTIRLESEGALIVSADKSDISKWQFVKTKYKYDSALMFLHDDDVYLVSRRNLDGEMDKANPKRRPAFRKKYNLLRYSFTKKCTALFKYDKEKKSLDWIMDFPSTGDNSFPAITQLNEHDFLLMNYTNDPEKGEKTWIRGQLGKTNIYYTVLSFR